jgi:hypothetical protein
MRSQSQNTVAEVAEQCSVAQEILKSIFLFLADVAAQQRTPEWALISQSILIQMG